MVRLACLYFSKNHMLNSPCVIMKQLHLCLHLYACMYVYAWDWISQLSHRLGQIFLSCDAEGILNICTYTLSSWDRVNSCRQSAATTIVSRTEGTWRNTPTGQPKLKQSSSQLWVLGSRQSSINIQSIWYAQARFDLEHLDFGLRSLSPFFQQSDLRTRETRNPTVNHYSYRG